MSTQAIRKGDRTRPEHYKHKKLG